MPQQPLDIGALVPLTHPGWAEAGRHLLAGLEVATREVNAAGGIGGRPLRLLVRDTAGSAEAAIAAVDEFAQLGVVAVAGEYHSVVARAAASRANLHEMPFLCSSAVLDALIEQPSEWVARVAPTQSRGWQLFAAFLLAEGNSRVAVVTDGGLYWESGTRILREYLVPRGCTVAEFQVARFNPVDLCDALVAGGTSALLLLVGFPEPAVTIVRSVRRDHRLAELMLGAPAGQPEFAQWSMLLGGDSIDIPFLRYLPERLNHAGARVERALHEVLGGSPSFVAFEGYDTVAVLAELLRLHGPGRAGMAGAWRDVAVEGSRGQIQFSRPAGIGAWQWTWPPIQVASRAGTEPDRFRILRIS